MLAYVIGNKSKGPEAEFEEKHGVQDTTPELTITSPDVDSNTLTMGNPMPESTLTFMTFFFEK